MLLFTLLSHNLLPSPTTRYQKLTWPSSLAPKYEELASLFAPHSARVTIAKVDATLNDVPDEIAGFPTIKLFPAGAANKAKPIDYSGSRTIEDLAKFVKENGSFKIDVYDGDVEMTDEGTQGVLGKLKDKVVGKGSKVSEEMQHQAPAATKGPVGGEAEEEQVEHKKGTVRKIVEGVEAIIDGVAGLDDDLDDHDEL